MKEELFSLVRTVDDPIQAQNRMREYLQARILLAMQDAGAMIPLAFQGGTALRFLFGLPRFSEDLDFALEGADDFDFGTLESRILDHLKREGYEVSARRRVDRVVESLLVSFPGILHDAGVSPHPSQRLQVRIEIDTRPPAGAHLETTIVRRHALLNLHHHDRSSLLAGKIHAILQRRWAKGRDFFDLFWYLSDPTWPDPNLTLLNNALVQTNWSGPPLDSKNWPALMRERVGSVDWKTVEQDVAPFLEPGPQVDLFGRDSTLRLLES